MEKGATVATEPRLSQPVRLVHFVLVVVVAAGGAGWTMSQALADLRESIQGLRVEIQETRVEIQEARIEIQETRIETRDLIADLRKELSAQIAEVRSHLGGRAPATGPGSAEGV